MKRTLVGTLLVMAATAAAFAGSASIDQRQTQMKAIAENAKAIAETFENRRRYDGRAMWNAADAIRGLSGKTIAEAFPDDSFGPPSSASPVIADNRQAFESLAGELERLANLLAGEFERSPDRLTAEMRMQNPTSAGNPLLRRKGEAKAGAEAAIPAEHLFHLMLQTCTSCHAKFRLRKDD
jgi:cytochrome c556